jgi:hypothetical protein
VQITSARSGDRIAARVVYPTTLRSDGSLLQESSPCSIPGSGCIEYRLSRQNPEERKLPLALRVELLEADQVGRLDLVLHRCSLGSRRNASSPRTPSEPWMNPVYQQVDQ